MATITKYYNWQEAALSAPINWATDNVCVALVSSSYTPNVVADAYFNVPAADEVTGTNYNPGGQQLANVQVTQANGIAYVSANNPLWAQSASGFGNARYGILYKATGNTANSPLCGYIDFVSDCSNDSGSFSIQWVANTNSGVIFTQEPDQFAYANLAYTAANSGIANAATANTNALAAYAAANAAANTVAVYVNGTLALSKANLNFNNTATINVSATANGTGQTNVAFTVNSAAVIPVPGGSNTNIQYNANGILGGSANLTFDDSTGNFTMICGTGQANINVQTMLVQNNGEARIVLSSNTQQPALIQYQSNAAVGGYTGVEHTAQSLVPGASQNGDMVVRSFAGNVLIAATTAGKNVVVSNGNMIVQNKMAIGPSAIPATSVTEANAVVVIQKWAPGTAPADIANGYYLLIGGTDYGATVSYDLIGFGYASQNSAPSFIGYEMTSQSGSTTGDLVFGTRSVTTDTQPTIQMRIANTGAVTMASDLTFTASGATIGDAPHTYGSLQIIGANSGYAGIQFPSAFGTLGRTLMVSTSAAIQGFYDTNLSAWDWYFQAGVLTVGTVPAASVSAGSLGSGNFTVTGTLTATTLNATSDRNKKKDITAIADARDIVASLNGVRFKWNDSGIASAGLIAQDVERVMPELVDTDDSGSKSLNYNGIIGALVEELKALRAEVEALKAR